MVFDFYFDGVTVKTGNCNIIYLGSNLYQYKFKSSSDRFVMLSFWFRFTSIVELRQSRVKNKQRLTNSAILAITAGDLKYSEPDISGFRLPTGILYPQKLVTITSTLKHPN